MFGSVRASYSPIDSHGARSVGAPGGIEWHVRRLSERLLTVCGQPVLPCKAGTLLGLSKWYAQVMTDVRNDRVMSAQEARELTMIERARRETGQTMTADEAIRWYEGWRAAREAADAE